jgi:hypothetical protein
VKNKTDKYILNILEHNHLQNTMFTLLRIFIQEQNYISSSLHHHHHIVLLFKAHTLSILQFIIDVLMFLSVTYQFITDVLMFVSAKY